MKTTGVIRKLDELGRITLPIEPANIVGNQVCFIGTGLDEQQIHTLFREETT